MAGLRGAHACTSTFVFACLGSPHCDCVAAEVQYLPTMGNGQIFRSLSFEQIIDCMLWSWEVLSTRYLGVLRWGWVSRGLVSLPDMAAEHGLPEEQVRPSAGRQAGNQAGRQAGKLAGRQAGKQASEHAGWVIGR